MKSDADKWNERYANPEYYYGTKANTFLEASARRINRGGRVLCIAEGEGRNAVYLAKLGYNVTAVDQSAVGLKKLSKLAKECSVTVEAIVADLEEYNIEPGKWDAIVSIWCHLPPTVRKKVHSEIVNGLKPGGILILESYHPRQLVFKTGGPPVADLMMTVKDLEAELKGLQFEILHEIERDVQEGRGHLGISAVTQALARKYSKI